MRLLSRGPSATPVLIGLAALAGCADADPAALSRDDLHAPVTTAATTANLTVGDPAPALTGFDVNGTPISLADFVGSYVLLEVGGGWCAPSRIVAPFLPIVDAALAGDGIPFVSLSALVDASAPGIPSDAAYTQAWLDAFYGGAYHPVLHMDGDPAVRAPWASVLTPYNAIPMLFLLAPDGTVLRVRVGTTSTAAELEAWVREGIAQGLPPTIESITGPTGPVPVATPVSVSGTWSARDDDDHTGTVDWGDGTVDPLVVNADGTWSSPPHPYSDIGFYRIEVTITDAGGGSDSAVLNDVLVVDPDAGFVVGAGSVVSPAGACLICEEWTEAPARFRLLSRYRKGASTPDGDFAFRFESGEFAFESAVQEWLLVNRGGGRAQVKGVGRLVGGPLAEQYPVDLHFMAWLDDAEPDALTLRIWLDDSAFGEEGIYDSFGAMPVAGGQILVKASR